MHWFCNLLMSVLPDLSDHLELLRQLNKTNQVWNETLDEIFENVKCLVTSSPVLAAYYKPEEDLVSQCNGSGTGVGAALLQKALLCTYRKGNASNSIFLGMVPPVYIRLTHCDILCDHKPLEIILKKSLIKAPKRLQNMIRRVEKYDVKLFYKPGNTLYLADTLSRAHTIEVKDPVINEEDINVVMYLPMSDERVSEIKRETVCDSTSSPPSTIANGWLQERCKFSESLILYWSY